MWAIAIGMFGFLLKVAAPLFIWVMCSFMLMAFLDPWYMALRRRGLPQFFSAVVLILISVIVIASFIYTFLHFSADVIVDLQESKKIFADYYHQLMQSVKGLTDGLNSLSGSAAAKDMVTGKPIPRVEVVEGSPFGGFLGETIRSGLGNAMTAMAYFFLWPILTFFLMLERDALAKVFTRGSSKPEQLGLIWAKMGVAIRAFFLGNLLLFLGTLPIFLLTFELFQLKSILTIALLASLLNAIPFVGAVLTGALPALMLLSQRLDATAAVWLYIVCALIHFVVANFVTPKILGSKVNINASAATICIVAWSLLWGGVGLLLAIPITAVIKILLEHSGHRWLVWLAALMSERIDRRVRLSMRWRRIKNAR